MSDIYKVNLTWTSPLIKYAPSTSWQSAISITNGSIASFSFYGNGFKWFGAANASTYSIKLDDQIISAQPRIYDQLGEGPTDLFCEAEYTWGCVVLAEASNLTLSEHTVQLNTSFPRALGDDKVNLLAVQTLYDTHFSSQSYVQTTQVPINDSRIVAAGDWKDAAYNGTNYRVSQTAGSTLSFQFKGYAVQLWGTDATESPFKVSIDGISQQVALPSSNTPEVDTNCLFWYSAGLDTSMHTVVVTNTATTGLGITGFSVSEYINTDNPGGSGGNDEQTSSGLSQGALAGIVIGILALLFALAAIALACLRLKQRRAVSVIQTREDINASSTPASATSTLLSLRPLLARTRRDTEEITPWSAPPEIRLRPSPYRLPPATPSPPNSSQTHQRSSKQPLPLPPSASRSNSMPVDSTATAQRDRAPPRRQSAPRIHVENVAGPANLHHTTMAERHKPPLHRVEEPVQSPSTPGSSIATGTDHLSMAAGASVDSPELNSTQVLPADATGADEEGGNGEGARPSTPPPAYEPQTEGTRESRRTRRQLQQTISKAIEERFRVVQND